MKEIRISKLSLKNFKGIKTLSINTNCLNTDIFGDNATGKTTIADAFTWLLFDKDSNNSKDFGIKPFELSGEAKHNLETEVEAILYINETELILKKIYQEKWTKKRGQITAEFTGHTTDYFINGVPSKKKEYTSQIEDLIDENIFKLLTNPIYFNESIKWQDRRRLLLEICGDITDEDVIAADARLDELSKILGNHSIDDLRKINSAKRREINNQLEKIPVRIDEVTAGIPDISEIDFVSISTQITNLEEKNGALRDTISSIQTGGIAEKKKQLAEIDTEILNLKNEHEQRKQNTISELRNRINELSIEFNSTNNNILKNNEEVKVYELQVESFENQLINLRTDWTNINDSTFEFTQESNCPTCGQAIPVEQIEKARENALSTFNLNKSKQLESINQQGQEIKARKKESRNKIDYLTSEIEKLSIKIKLLEEQINMLENEAKKSTLRFTKLEDIPQYKKIVEQKQTTELEIASISVDKQDEILKLKNEVEINTQQLLFLQSELAKKEQYEKAQSRIQELKAEEKRLAKEFGKVESDLYLTEEFIKTKVNMLTDKINNKFKMAKFKLFETQINGGISECCEVMYKGVPYSDLNNAAKINTGLDIINTLSEHYEFKAPIFIDNAESVTQLEKTKNQVIRLIVSDQDKKLRIETEPEEYKEAV